ncbi:hypothetical protein D3C81_974550 [compost metagenome]
MITKAMTNFEFNVIPNIISEQELIRYCDRMREQFAKLTKNWTNDLNHEWVLRSYLAIKLILSSTVMVNSMRYAIERNLRLVEPYLIYYSIFNTCRALVLMLPSQRWNEGKLLRMTHESAINITCDSIRVISQELGEQLKPVLEKAKGFRELFSYHFPANGIRSLPKKYRISPEHAIEICSLNCELAQFISEVLQQSLKKNAPGEYELNMDKLKTGYFYSTSELNFIDREDWYRLDYITRKVKKPYCLAWMVTDGMLEDFFGSWYPEDESDYEEGFFNPDKDLSIIFSRGF